MCKGELLSTNDLVMKISKTTLKQVGIKEIKYSKTWIPLVKWAKPEPKYTKLQETKKCIKTWGIIKYKNYHRLVSDSGLIRSVWKYNFTPKKFRVKNNILYFMIPKHKTAFWYTTKNNKFYFLLLPQKIYIDKKFCEGLGLLEGEMIKSMRGKSKHYVSFTNSQPDLVNHVLDIIPNLGIEKNKISAQIILNTKGKDTKEIDELKCESLKYWVKNTKIHKNQFVKILIDKRYRTNSYLGSLSIKYYDTFLRLIFQNIIGIIEKDIITKDKEFTKSFLRGLIAAEGNINLSAFSNSINFVSIGVTKPKERKFYRYLFRKIGIKPGGVILPVSIEEAKKRGWKRGFGGYFMIQGLHNYLKIHEYKLLELAPKKLLYFLFGLSNHQNIGKKINMISSELEKLKERYNTESENLVELRNKLTKREKEVLVIIKSSISTEYVAKRFKINRASASRILNSIYRKGFLEKKYTDGKVVWSKR